MKFGIALFVAATAAGVSAQQVPVFRAGVDLVTVGVTVTDRRGGLVTGLTADDFDVYEDGKKQTIRYVSEGDASGPDRPGPAMHLGLVLDVSESMGDDIRFTQTAAVKFLNTLLDAVDITFVDFDTEVRVTRYSQADVARLIERIRLQKTSGLTALYDAIGVYLDDAAAQDGRKIMLLYTDGADTRSSMNFGELIKLLKASDVTVYAIGELEHLPSSAVGGQRLLLEQIANATGGRAFFPLSARELDSEYEKVLAEIRAQYTIGYLSTNARTDGTWRNVEVKVVRTEARTAKVRSRKGYFAPFVKPDGG